MGAGGSAWADGAVGIAITDAEINEMAKLLEDFSCRTSISVIPLWTRRGWRRRSPRR
jgi:hypothetical protein